MRLAQVENGTVVNVIEVGPGSRPDFALDWPAAGKAGPGWGYDGKKFLPPAAPEPAPSDINAERDRRLTAGFSFGGAVFDCDPASLQRITGAATLAGFAAMAGAMPGDLRWHGGPDDFVWIAADNTLAPMDAATCFAFGQAAASHQSRLIFAAKALKSKLPIPADFAADRHWH